MTYLLDYSARRLSGAIIKSAGYSGAIRYVGGTATKHVSTTEYKSILASGLTFHAVMEVDIGDANGGWNNGVAYAQRAKAHCDDLGYGGVIFFCNDAPSLPSSTLWDNYLTGAASVLGWDRVGAYGFANAMDVARNLTPCRYFWLAGSVKGVDPRKAYLNFWQDNNHQVTVGGITCDRNLVLKPMEEDMPTAEEIAETVWGFKNPAAGDAVDMHQYVKNSAWSYRGAADKADMHQLLVNAAADAALAAADAKVVNVLSKLDNLAAALSNLDVKVSNLQMGGGSGATPEQVADEIAHRLES